jgi:DNA-binding transcriptional MerR regulator
MYHTQEFAKLAGLTVRALHHYDRLGLLKPHRTGSGYRAYCESDLERLEQVVALKFLGLPLKQIKRLLETAGCDLPAALQLQRKALEAKRRLLDRAIAAIREAETVVEAGRQPGASLPAYAALKKIIEVIEVQNNQDWMAKYQNDAAKAKIAERRHLWSPELQEQVSRQWIELIRDVEASLGEDPAGEKSQALAGRWMTLVEGFTGGDPDVTDAVKNVWADSANWPAEAKQQMQPFRISPEVWSFINKAIRERKNKTGSSQ